jgi:hypothetical protein
MRVGTAIMRALDVNRDAMLVAVAHGQIKCWGQALKREDLNRPIEHYQNRMISLYNRQVVILPGRAEPVNEQLEMAS